MYDQAETIAERDIRVCGMADSVQMRISKKTKEAWCIIDLDDGLVKIETLVFARTYKQFKQYCVADTPIVVCGKLSKRQEDDHAKIIAQEIYPLEEAIQKFGEKMVVGINAESDSFTKRIANLRKLMDSAPGKLPLTICLLYKAGKKKILVSPRTGTGVDASLKFLADAEKAMGRHAVKFIGRRAIYLNPPRKKWEGAPEHVSG